MEVRNAVRRGLWLWLLALQPAMGWAALPGETDLRQVLEQRMACAQAPGGMVAGVIEGDARVVVGVGRANEGGVAPDGDTLFEIASVSKLFTGLLLADATLRGELALDDRASIYLPPGIAVPKGGEAISLLDLATHYAGLPRDPKGYRPGESYAMDDGWALFSAAKLEHAPGETFRYSNVGVAVLGNLIARQSGRDYATLLYERIARPLGLADTVIAVEGARAARLAVGYDARGRPLPPTTGLETFPGASEVRSSANDLLRFVAAAMAPDGSVLRAAFDVATEPRRAANLDVAYLGLGYDIDRQEGRPLIYHGGDRIDGFSAFVAYDPQRRRGAVVLSNSRRQLGDVAWQLLDPSRPLEPCGYPEPPRLALAPAALDPFIGDYRVTEGFVVHVVRRKDRLQAYADGRPHDIEPIARDRFLSSKTRVTLTFLRDAEGHVDALYLQQGGQFLKGHRAP